MVNCKCYKIVTERCEHMISKFKKFKLVSAATIVLVTIVPQITYADLSLSMDQINMPSGWAEVEVSKSMEIGLIPERIQSNYGNSITREEFSELAVTLYENLSRKKVTPQMDNPFDDTQNPKVIIANQLGLVEARTEGLFLPYEKITREEASTVIYNTLKIAKPKYDYSEFYEYEFEDYSSISSWAREAVGYLYGIEVINGDNEDFFNPEGIISREEGIVLIKRTHDKVIEADRSSKRKLTVSRGRIRQAENQNIKQLKDLVSKQLGKPYKTAAAGPNSFDCSGLTYYLYGQLGIKLPRSSKTQINAGVQVSRDNLEYGDLVLFARDGENINHVGIYVGDGNFVHSPQTGDVVKIQTLTSGYYSNSYYAARRVLQ